MSGQQCEWSIGSAGISSREISCREIRGGAQAPAWTSSRSAGGQQGRSMHSVYSMHSMHGAAQCSLVLLTNGSGPKNRAGPQHSAACIAQHSPIVLTKGSGSNGRTPSTEDLRSRMTWPDLWQPGTQELQQLSAGTQQGGAQGKAFCAAMHATHRTGQRGCALLGHHTIISAAPEGIERAALQGFWQAPPVVLTPDRSGIKVADAWGCHLLHSRCCAHSRHSMSLQKGPQRGFAE